MTIIFSNRSKRWGHKDAYIRLWVMGEGLWERKTGSRFLVQSLPRKVLIRGFRLERIRSSPQKKIKGSELNI